jgi:peptidyl-tRNA hydrolase, PTH2 family
MRTLKQVIVMRNDLNIGRGKMVAQGAHASGMFLVHRLHMLASEYHATVPSDEMEWIATGMTKICVCVDSEAKLLEIAANAGAAGLRVHVITDAGRTEFGGVPTKTCLAIGPNESDAIDTVTGHLKLL